MGKRNFNNVTDTGEQEAAMVRYLLGQSPKEERAQVEERYFSDGEYFDQLLALEDSLIDDFVTGRMPAEQLAAFKESLSGRDDDIRFSGALFRAVTKKKLDQPAPQREPRLPAKRQPLFAPQRSFRLGISVAALALIGLGLFFFLRSQTLQTRLSETEAQLEASIKAKESAEQELNQTRSQSESSERELAIERDKRIDAENSLKEQGRTKSPNGSSDFKTIVLSASFISRGAASETREVRISEKVRWLRFEMPVKGYGEYESLRISIKLVGGREVLSRGPLTPTMKSSRLSVTVPAADLGPGDYIVTLYGERLGATRTELERYPFRIAPLE